jgi:hypothetical protein
LIGELRDKLSANSISFTPEMRAAIGKAAKDNLDLDISAELETAQVSSGSFKAVDLLNVDAKNSGPVLPV